MRPKSLQGCASTGTLPFQFDYAFRQREELKVNLAGKVFYLKVGCKAG